jgi:hypothetical protein
MRAVSQTRTSRACAVVMAGVWWLAGVSCDDDGGTTRDGGRDASAEVAPGAGNDGGGQGDGGPGTADTARDASSDGSADVKVTDAGPDTPPADGPASGPHSLDVVFLIDNSVTMREEQDSLRAAFPTFMNVLANLPGGRPDLRIGIVSSNFGAGPTMPSPECPPLGDRGVFQVKPGCGLDVSVSRWLAVDRAGNSNFTGALPAVFSCLASLGVNGCGYEHQLQSLRAAFADNVTPQNTGFLRADAYLAIVIISDEDDCSGEPESTLYRDQIPGQAGSLRCSLVGHQCNGQPVPATAGFRAPLASCAPVTHAKTPDDRLRRLINVDDFVDFIKAVKGFRAERILVSNIIGWNDSPGAEYGLTARPSPSNPMEVEVDLMPVCQHIATGTAAPGIRLRAFAQAFANHTVHSICAADLTPAMEAIARKLGDMFAAGGGTP